jgi:hypothetical protein
LEAFPEWRKIVLKGPRLWPQSVTGKTGNYFGKNWERCAAIRIVSVL